MLTAGSLSESFESKIVEASVFPTTCIRKVVVNCEEFPGLKINRIVKLKFFFSPPSDGMKLL